MPRQRSRPRSPFVVTFALAGAAVACSGSTSSDPSSATGGSGGALNGGSGGSGGSVGGSGGVGVGGGGIGGFGGDGIGGCGANPPSIPCPGEPPAIGSACPTYDYDDCFSFWWGTSCSYPDPCGGNGWMELDCGGTTWTLQTAPSCTTCPAAEPAIGEACTPDPNQVCSYVSGHAYTCTSASQWAPVCAADSGVACDAGTTPVDAGTD